MKTLLLCRLSAIVFMASQVSIFMENSGSPADS